MSLRSLIGNYQNICVRAASCPDIYFAHATRRVAISKQNRGKEKFLSKVHYLGIPEIAIKVACTFYTNNRHVDEQEPSPRKDGLSIPDVLYMHLSTLIVGTSD